MVVVEVRRRKREANIIKLVARWVEQTSHFAGCVQPRHAEKRVLFLFLSFSFLKTIFSFFFCVFVCVPFSSSFECKTRVFPIDPVLFSFSFSIEFCFFFKLFF